jgi:hypothetical protein
MPPPRDWVVALPRLGVSKIDAVDQPYVGLSSRVEVPWRLCLPWVGGTSLCGTQGGSDQSGSTVYIEERLRPESWKCFPKTSSSSQCRTNNSASCSYALRSSSVNWNCRMACCFHHVGSYGGCTGTSIICTGTVVHIQQLSAPNRRATEHQGLTAGPRDLAICSTEAYSSGTCPFGRS